ncbi:hypothetical protein AI27_19785 [Sphingomonas sp. BHC-A]|nr:hypothetical protein AI27_19785 [Sphingomonas sp. BHC-A]
MLPRRHFGRIGLGAVLVERSEDLEMRVQPLDRLLDQAVAAALGDQPMEQRVRLREAGIGLLVALDDRVHVRLDRLEDGERLVVHLLGGAGGGIGFDQQAQRVEVMHLLRRHLRAGAVADIGGLVDQLLRLQLAQRLANRGLRNAELPRHGIDGDAFARRDLHRHQHGEKMLIGALHQRRAGSGARCGTDGTGRL